VHLFLIPIERAISDSQMIFVLWKHTLFAAGAKLCDSAKKLIGSGRKSRWDRALRLVGSTLVSTAAMIEARSIGRPRQSAKSKSAPTRTRKFHCGEARGWSLARCSDGLA
jgi:hypothetical protein